MIIPAKLLIVSSASLIASYALAANDTPSQADANAHPIAVIEPSTVLLESAKLAKPIKLSLIHISEPTRPY